MERETLVNYLDDLFEVRLIEDSSRNGMQVQAPERIRKVGFAVDACQATIAEAREQSVDLLVVHHGLFWKNVQLVTDIHYRRLKMLLAEEIGVYAVHIPLDSHAELGNNRQLTDLLGAAAKGKFADFLGRQIGVIAEFKEPESSTTLVGKIETALATKCKLLPFGPGEIKTIGIVSGGGAGYLAEAADRGCDAFLTGEPEHVMYHIAREKGTTVIIAGHYATETVGLKALQKHLTEQFSLETTFIDMPTGL